ncbi:MAG: methionyl-tRNA formyltransferase [Spirochaetaceae bacterium]|jgi:methionyl-tRNA formyltransferase|nr:methionyl-tRNA formyltransferase [Spirochaetaceae bacterium]
MSIRILFAGNPAIACPALDALAQLQRAGVCELSGVLTNTDAARGRHGTVTPSPVASAAQTLAAAEFPALRLFKTAHLDDTLTSRIAAHKADALVSFAYGALFPPRFLALFPLGGFNIHPSLLPRHRGATPLQTTILRRDPEWGVCIQRLSSRLDAGNIVARRRYPLHGTETGDTLTRRAAETAAELLREFIPTLKSGAFEETPQDETAASYCEKFTRDSGQIHWCHDARDIDAHIRALTPEIRCWTTHDGRPLNILEGSVFSGTIKPDVSAEAAAGTVLGVDKQHGVLIQCGAGTYAARVLQYQTKKALDFRSFLNGTSIARGAILG